MVADYLIKGSKITLCIYLTFGLFRTRIDIFPVIICFKKKNNTNVSDEEDKEGGKNNTHMPRNHDNHSIY